MESNVVVMPVSSGTLLRAIVRLNSEKHAAKIAAIQAELNRRAEFKRAA